MADGTDCSASFVPPSISAGDNAWMLASCALVMLMTPGLGMFYGGERETTGKKKRRGRERKKKKRGKKGKEKSAWFFSHGLPFCRFSLFLGEIWDRQSSGVKWGDQT